MARTGYTGEDGIEVFFRTSDALKFWKRGARKRKGPWIKPCGLGARDTLRLECVTRSTAPIFLGTQSDRSRARFFVDLTKPNFTGRDVLVKAKENGTQEKLVAFKMTTKARRRARIIPCSIMANASASDQAARYHRAELGCRHGLHQKLRTRNRKQDRHRDSRAEISGQIEKNRSTKIMNVVPTICFYTESHEWI